MGQGREDRWRIRWELRLRNETVSISELIFVCHGIFITKLSRFWCPAEQVHSHVGIELRSGHRFKHAHMLVFYHPLSLLCPLLLFPSILHYSTSSSSFSPVVRNPLLTAPAVCIPFMSNVSVAGSPHKATSIDWKTIQFSLARLAARCGLDLCFVAWLCGAKAIATWLTGMVSKIHPAHADEASRHRPNCSWCTTPLQHMSSLWRLVYSNSVLLLWTSEYMIENPTFGLWNGWSDWTQEQS